MDLQKHYLVVEGGVLDEIEDHLVSRVVVFSRVTPK